MKATQDSRLAKLFFFARICKSFNFFPFFIRRDSSNKALWDEQEIELVLRNLLDAHYHDNRALVDAIDDGASTVELISILHATLNFENTARRKTNEEIEEEEEMIRRAIM